MYAHGLVRSKSARFRLSGSSATRPCRIVWLLSHPDRGNYDNEDQERDLQLDQAGSRRACHRSQSVPRCAAAFSPASDLSDTDSETRYVRREGLFGQLDFGRSLWAVTFNNGDNGVGYVHWIAGAGTVRAVRYDQLGDAQNVVKGLPRLVSRSRVGRYAVAVYEYPDYPAGGANGSHSAAFVRCGARLVFASIHGHGNGHAATDMAVDLARRSGCR